MRVVLLAYTQMNPELSDHDPEGSDVRYLLDQGREEFASHLIEFAGRVCYRSTEKQGRAPGFIAARIHEGHEDIIEHCSATFLIEGISRAASHQLVRHRLASYSQESQRYTDLSRIIQAEEEVVVTPPAIAANPEAHARFDKAMHDLEEAYRELRALGIRKEDSRFLLPNAATTRLIVSMNFRAWRHFLWLRCDKAAQWEIRAVAYDILRHLYRLSPAVFQDIYNTFLIAEDARVQEAALDA